ncbi:MAG: muconolactone Delta-isomerase family protein [Kofleriaceae bacterium]
MKVLAIGRIEKPMSDAQRAEVFQHEVPHTLQMYLQGTIEHFWARTDTPGVAFILNVDSLDKAHAALNGMPLVVGGFVKYEVWPVGPLAPLGHAC